MASTKTLALEQDMAWFIVVPKRQEFSEPTFHFGERVRWLDRDELGQRINRTGRITGMNFEEDGWYYTICISLFYQCRERKSRIEIWSQLL